MPRTVQKRTFYASVYGHCKENTNEKVLRCIEYKNERERLIKLYILQHKKKVKLDKHSIIKYAQFSSLFLKCCVIS